MTAFEHVLFACDFAAGSEVASRHVEWLGSGGSALLVHVQPSAWKHWATSGAAERQAWERAERWAGALTRAGVATRALVAQGNPAEVILGLARSEPCVELLVLGHSAASPLERLVGGSTSETVARFAEQPVWLAHPATRGIRKLLCGVDASPSSRLALEQAASLAARFDAGLSVAGVLHEPAFNPSGMPHDEVTERRDTAREQQIRVLDAFVDGCRLAAPIAERQYLWGEPHEVLAGLAHDGRFDVLVVGRAGHSRLHRVLMGSTAHRLVRHAPCSLLVVGQPEQEE